MFQNQNKILLFCSTSGLKNGESQDPYDMSSSLQPNVQEADSKMKMNKQGDDTACRFRDGWEFSGPSGIPWRHGDLNKRIWEEAKKGMFELPGDFSLTLHLFSLGFHRGERNESGKPPLVHLF